MYNNLLSGRLESEQIGVDIIKKIMLVEANKETASTIEAVIGRLGDLETFETHTAALLKLQQVRPDVIIAHVGKDEIVAIAFVRAVRAAERIADISRAPIILLTGGGRSKTIAELEDTSVVDEVLEKPFTNDNLRNAVRTFLGFET